MINVLLVDDEPDILKAMSRVVARIGGHSVVAIDGRSTDMIGATEFFMGTRQIDLIISDIDMPVMNGIEFARKCRELFPDIPIVLMTGGDTDRVGIPDGVTVYDKIDLAGRLVEIIKKHAMLAPSEKYSNHDHHDFADSQMLAEQQESARTAESDDKPTRET